MKVNDIGTSYLPFGEQDGQIDSSRSIEPSHADVELFNASMGQHDRESSEPTSMSMLNTVSDQVNSSNRLSQQWVREAKKVSDTSDPLAAVEMSRALSRYALAVSFTTKVVNKSAQALDKITNLQ